MVAKSGNWWHLAPSLVDLVEEIDARWPNRKTTSDGSVGDVSHATRPSEHNPDRDSDGMPRGAVSAVDITKDSAAQMTALRKALKDDPRVWYYIHDRKIYSRTNGFVAKPYTGSNPHTAHLHVSLQQTKAAHDDTSSWGIASSNPTTDPKPDPKPAKVPPTILRGSKGAMVATLQRFLGVRPDSGIFGPNTAVAVRRYQTEQGLVADGVVGPKTWARIMTALDIPGYNA